MDSPRGRVYLMRAAAEGRIGLTPGLARHLDLCLGCRGCETACPSGVPFGQLLEATRDQLERHGVHAPESDHRTRRWALETFPYPARLAPLLWGLRLYQATGLQALVRASGVLAPWKKVRSMEALLPSVPAAPALPEYIAARGKPKGRAGLLTGCVQRFLFGDVNERTARLLSAAGWDVVVPPSQGCCGALHLHAGRLDDFRSMASRLIAVFGEVVDVVVTNAAGCGSAMKEYGHWLPGETAAAFAGKVRDISEVLVDSDLPLGELKMTVAYHDACHLVHGQKVRTQPRELLRRIPGLAVVDIKDSDLCCGSAGIYNLTEPDMARTLGRMKVERIRETGARVVAAGNPGCLIQIAGHARDMGVELEVVHPVDLLARALRET
jgi:glycolate oxidase iron-sulfur subunit